MSIRRRLGLIIFGKNSSESTKVDFVGTATDCRGFDTQQILLLCDNYLSIHKFLVYSKSLAQLVGDSYFCEEEKKISYVERANLVLRQN